MFPPVTSCCRERERKKERDMDSTQTHIHIHTQRGTRSVLHKSVQESLTRIHGCVPTRRHMMARHRCTHTHTWLSRLQWCGSRMHDPLTMRELLQQWKQGCHQQGVHSRVRTPHTCALRHRRYDASFRRNTEKHGKDVLVSLLLWETRTPQRVLASRVLLSYVRRASVYVSR